MKKVGLLVLLMFGFAHVGGTEVDYSKMSINELNNALIRAVEQGSFGEVQALVGAGANVNGEITITGTLGRGEGAWDYRDDYTLLQYAAMHGYLDILKELIKGGALIHADHNHGPAALVGASRAGHVDVVRELIKADVNVSRLCLGAALHGASAEGHVDVVRELIKAGANVNHVDGLKQTPLGRASENGHVDVIRELIKAGAHVNLTSKKGDTALMCAIKKHDFDVVQSLLQSPEFHTGIWQLIRDLFSDSGTNRLTMLISMAIQFLYLL